MPFLTTTLLSTALLFAAQATAEQAAPHERFRLKVTMEDYSTHYIDNMLDHFNDHDDRTYKQRYWYNDKFYAGQDAQAPVFLYICGEWTCTPPDEEMFPMMVGAEHGALLYSLEHRYYGDSQPFEDWSTDNLKYLSSEQALADIASFIDNQNERLGYKADWIVVGGSYPGALSAWFKSQYPDHAIGAWSSSGVIHAIKDFKTFDLDIFMRTDKSSPECSGAIRRAIDIVERDFKTKEGTDQVAELFGITRPINKRDFWFYYADIFTMGVQYGTRLDMCEKLQAAAAEGEDSLMGAVADLAVNGGLDYDQYDAVALSNTEIDINSSLRQWTYQYCTEFGFFQTPNIEQPLRSQAINFGFWPDYCARVFGRPIETRTEQTNKLYGGLDIKGDNIFFLNGSEDPWQYAAMRQLRHPDTTQATMNVEYINCDTCAHCVDFHTPEEGQDPALSRAQNAVADQVAIWLEEAKLERMHDAAKPLPSEPRWEDIDYEKKRLDLDEQMLPGDGSVVFLQ